MVISNGGSTGSERQVEATLLHVDRSVGRIRGIRVNGCHPGSGPVNSSVQQAEAESRAVGTRREPPSPQLRAKRHDMNAARRSLHCMVHSPKLPARLLPHPLQSLALGPAALAHILILHLDHKFSHTTWLSLITLHLHNCCWDDCKLHIISLGKLNVINKRMLKYPPHFLRCPKQCHTQWTVTEDFHRNANSLYDVNSLVLSDKGKTSAN